MNYQDYADIFKVLSDTNRIKILSIIHKEQEVCVCKIIEHFDITQPTFSYHMKLLQDVELVTCRKVGTSCYYKINYEKINIIKNYLINFE